MGIRGGWGDPWLEGEAGRKPAQAFMSRTRASTREHLSARMIPEGLTR